MAEYIRKSDKEEYRWENLVSNKFIENVDKGLLKKYTNQAHDVGRIAIGYTDKKTVLNQLELSEGDRLINAGKVLFADDLTQDIQMTIFATSERLTFNDIQRYHGQVLKLVDIAENYIKSNIHWKVKFTGALQRIAEACDNAGVKYEFKKVKSGFVVCFYRNQEMFGDRVEKNIDKASNEALNKNELIIIKVILEKPSIKQKEIVAQTNISRAQVQRIMKSLQERGIIFHEGPKKTG